MSDPLAEVDLYDISDITCIITSNLCVTKMLPKGTLINKDAI